MIDNKIILFLLFITLIIVILYNNKKKKEFFQDEKPSYLSNMYTTLKDEKCLSNEKEIEMPRKYKPYEKLCYSKIEKGNVITDIDDAETNTDEAEYLQKKSKYVGCYSIIDKEDEAVKNYFDNYLDPNGATSSTNNSNYVLKDYNTCLKENTVKKNPIGLLRKFTNQSSLDNLFLNKDKGYCIRNGITDSGVSISIDVDKNKDIGVYLNKGSEDNKKKLRQIDDFYCRTKHYSRGEKYVGGKNAIAVYFDNDNEKLNKTDIQNNIDIKNNNNYRYHGNVNEDNYYTLVDLYDYNQNVLAYYYADEDFLANTKYNKETGDYNIHIPKNEASINIGVKSVYQDNENSAVNLHDKFVREESKDEKVFDDQQIYNVEVYEEEEKKNYANQHQMYTQCGYLCYEKGKHNFYGIIDREKACYCFDELQNNFKDVSLIANGISNNWGGFLRHKNIRYTDVYKSPNLNNPNIKRFILRDYSNNDNKEHFVLNYNWLHFEGNYIVSSDELIRYLDDMTYLNPAKDEKLKKIHLKKTIADIDFGIHMCEISGNKYFGASNYDYHPNINKTNIVIIDDFNNKTTLKPDCITMTGLAEKYSNNSEVYMSKLKIPNERYTLGRINYWPYIGQEDHCGFGQCNLLAITRVMKPEDLQNFKGVQQGADKPSVVLEEKNNLFLNSSHSLLEKSYHALKEDKLILFNLNYKCKTDDANNNKKKNRGGIIGDPIISVSSNRTMKYYSEEREYIPEAFHWCFIQNYIKPKYYNYTNIEHNKRYDGLLHIDDRKIVAVVFFLAEDYGQIVMDTIKFYDLNGNIISPKKKKKKKNGEVYKFVQKKNHNDVNQNYRGLPEGDYNKLYEERSIFKSRTGMDSGISLEKGIYYPETKDYFMVRFEKPTNISRMVVLGQNESGETSNSLSKCDLSIFYEGTNFPYGDYTKGTDNAAAGKFKMTINGIYGSYSRDYISNFNITDTNRNFLKYYNWSERRSLGNIGKNFDVNKNNNIIDFWHTIFIKGRESINNDNTNLSIELWKTSTGKYGFGIKLNNEKTIYSPHLENYFSNDNLDIFLENKNFNIKIGNLFYNNSNLELTDFKIIKNKDIYDSKESMDSYAKIYKSLRNGEVNFINNVLKIDNNRFNITKRKRDFINVRTGFNEIFKYKHTGGINNADIHGYVNLKIIDRDGKLKYVVFDNEIGKITNYTLEELEKKLETNLILYKYQVFNLDNSNDEISNKKQIYFVPYFNNLPIGLLKIRDNDSKILDINILNSGKYYAGDIGKNEQYYKIINFKYPVDTNFVIEDLEGKFIFKESNINDLTNYDKKLDLGKYHTLKKINTNNKFNYKNYADIIIEIENEKLGNLIEELDTCCSYVRIQNLSTDDDVNTKLAYDRKFNLVKTEGQCETSDYIKEYTGKDKPINATFMISLNNKDLDKISRYTFNFSNKKNKDKNLIKELKDYTGNETNFSKVKQYIQTTTFYQDNKNGFYKDLFNGINEKEKLIGIHPNASLNPVKDEYLNKNSIFKVKEENYKNNVNKIFNNFELLKYNEYNQTSGDKKYIKITRDTTQGIIEIEKKYDLLFYEAEKSSTTSIPSNTGRPTKSISEESLSYNNKDFTNITAAGQLSVG